MVDVATPNPGRSLGVDYMAPLYVESSTFVSEVVSDVSWFGGASSVTSHSGWATGLDEKMETSYRTCISFSMCRIASARDPVNRVEMVFSFRPSSKKREKLRTQAEPSSKQTSPDPQMVGFLPVLWT